jgi:cyclophilin family peptidyl-prolyl cis-trans isomerase
MFAMIVRHLIALGLICVWSMAAAAQESAPADAPPDPTQAERASKAPATPEGAEFEKLFDQWKDLIAKLRGLQIEYRAAKPSERQALEEQYNELVAQAEAMEPAIKSGAEAAYLAAPNQDKDIANFLAALVKHDVAHDAYEEALPRASLLIENDFDNKRLYSLAGVAAVNTNDFEAAERYLRTAEESRALDEKGSFYLGMLDDLKERWEREQEIREREAKVTDPKQQLPRVLLKTSKGEIVVELFENEAPNTVANFISLVEGGTYNGLVFHRVLPGFMAQGGDPAGDGSGGPGYNIPCECYEEGHRLHFRGSLSMANTGERDTGGSQFFLTFVPTTHLDGKHTVFGRVVEGMDVLAKLQRIDPEKPGTERPDKIVEATVVRKRPHEYKPKTLPE